MLDQQLTEPDGVVVAGCGGVEPVALVLEGVGGEVDGAGTATGEERLPVDGDASGVEFAEGGDELAGFGAVAALGREED
ncbi:hypothetical protein ACFW3Y_28070, partial [Streptomyces rochei]|uniref:hypothetical protein n=1 Tax=Streptomyces rochei TaxID=1928 RepID=UPI0036C87E1F